MNRSSALRIALALSLLINVGVLGAVGYRTIESGSLSRDSVSGFQGLVRHLELSDEQQRRWHEAESAFLAAFRSGAVEIHERRDRLIGAIFADAPDPVSIEAERAGIARLQNEQQRLVIEQLLREREILDARQRQRLAQLLSSQPVGALDFEQLHRD